jgi:hypothetical protein
MPDKPKSTRKHDDPAQSRRFIEAAHEAGAEESEKAADQAFKKIATAKRSAEHTGRVNDASRRKQPDGDQN